MYIVIFTFLTLFSSCSWLQSHPKIIEDIVADETKTIEDVIEDSKSSSPGK